MINIKKLRVGNILNCSAGFGSTIKVELIQKNKVSFVGKILEDDDFKGRNININYNTILEVLK